MNKFLVGLIVIVIIIGVFLIIRAIRSKSYKGDSNSLVYKEDLPIVPRAERMITEATFETYNHETSDDGDQDALSTLAKAVSKSTQNPQKTPDESVDDLAEPTAKVSHHFPQKSPIIDEHLDKEKDFERDNNPLSNAKDSVTLCIIPRNQTVGLSGKEVLELARTYGLKYGIMNMYHRYENDDGSGMLWFSMLGMNRQGAVIFDINNLSNQRFTGLSLFLPLPHPQALRGFDSMVHTAHSMATALNADLLDEENYVIDRDLLGKLRQMVANYQ